VPRDGDRFDAVDFGPGGDRDQVFLTWELPLSDPRVARALGIVVDDAPVAAEEDSGEEGEGGLWLDGEPARLCPASGRFLPTPDQAIT
jgi:hypothetical protein